MKSIKLFLLFIATLSLGLQSFASTDVAPPKWVNVYGADGFKYWLVKKLVMDVDKTLRSEEHTSELQSH